MQKSEATGREEELHVALKHVACSIWLHLCALFVSIWCWRGQGLVSRRGKEEGVRKRERERARGHNSETLITRATKP